MTTMVESLFQSRFPSLMAVSPRLVHMCCSRVTSCVTRSMTRWSDAARQSGGRSDGQPLYAKICASRCSQARPPLKRKQLTLLCLPPVHGRAWNEAILLSTAHSSRIKNFVLSSFINWSNLQVEPPITVYTWIPISYYNKRLIVRFWK